MASEGSLRSESNEARNFVAPGVRKMSFLKHDKIVPIGDKKRIKFGTTRGRIIHSSSIVF